MESTITVKGQTTIPKVLREHLGVRAGDRVKYFIDPDGHVVILPKLPIEALKGIVQTSKRASLKDMERAIAAGATRRHRRAAKK